MNNLKTSRTRLLNAIILFACVFVGGILVGRYLFLVEGNQKTDFSETNTSYKFISPLLFCRDQNLNNQAASDIEAAVSDYINQEKGNNDIIDAALYFKDLNGGPWALVNPDYRSAPSSLLKVPVAISVYLRAEQDPSFLNTKLTMPKDLSGINVNQNEHFSPREKVQPNTAYTVEELVRLMLEDSDNTAVYMLGNLFRLPDLQAAFTHLGIEAPVTGDQGYSITVKTFASFFRVLYSGTYLSQSNSEHLLSRLVVNLYAGARRGIACRHDGRA